MGIFFPRAMTLSDKSPFVEECRCPSLWHPHLLRSCQPWTFPVDITTDLPEMGSEPHHCVLWFLFFYHSRPSSLPYRVWPKPHLLTGIIASMAQSGLDVPWLVYSKRSLRIILDEISPHWLRAEQFHLGTSKLIAITTLFTLQLWTCQDIFITFSSLIYSLYNCLLRL